MMRVRGIRRFTVGALFLLVAGMTVTVASPVAAQVTSTRQPLNVVVLGDSYSAGNGARDADGDRAYYGPKGCYRSDYSWNGLYVESLKTTFDPIVSRVACSGGVLGDLTSRRDMKDVNVVPRFIGCPSAKWDEEWQRTDLDFLSAECRRFVKPQVESVGSSTDLVLLTGGGNDAKFAKIVEQCFVTGFRDPGDCRSNVQFADSVVSTQLGARLDTVFGALRGRLRPDAQVLFVGYPYLVDDVNYTLKSINPFNDDEYAAGDNVRRMGVAGDDVQRAAIARSNAVGPHSFTFVDGVDVKALFAGKEPNPDQSSPRNPNRWLYEFETRIAAEWYHFNPKGHQGLADFLAARYMPTRGGGDGGNDVDIVFVVDTTGSMGGVIGSVRNNLTAIVDNLAASTRSFRVGVVSYRDFPERTGSSADYPSRVDTPLTDDRAAIAAAISSLTANAGGDTPESVLSGMNTGLGLSWRAGVTKVMVVIGDAPPLGPPEPITGLTVEDIVRRALEIDPVQVFVADTGSLGNASMATIASGTGGSVIRGGDIVATIQEVVGTVATQPFAWLAGPYAGTVGEPYVFDATGSYDPSGEPLTGFEWDVDGDGAWDATTATPTLSWTFAAPFSGVAVVRVTGEGGTALGSAWIDITESGSASMGDEEECAVDADGNPVVSDDDGRQVDCTATLQPDPPGIVVTSTGSQPGFVGPVFDLSPSDGRAIAADAGQGVLTLRGDRIMEVIPLPGVTAVDQVRRGAVWAVTGAGDDPTQDTGQALWFIEDGEPRQVANLYAFEAANNPDGNDPFDSNPYAVHAIDEETVLIVDAGANALLKADIDGAIEVLAVFPDELVSTANLKSLAGCPDSEAQFCALPDMMPAQAVPTSIAVAGDGTIYVGELKGFPGPTGVSNIWRVAPTASNAACGSDASCTKAFDGGFTSIVDLVITPDGQLLVAEMDERSWAAVEIFGTVTGGTVSRCTLTRRVCEEVHADIPMLSSLVLVGRSLWVAQNILAATGSEVVRIR